MEKKTYYNFTALPFCLSTACNIFTKFLKPLLSRWRSQSMKVILYLDDGIVYSRSKPLLIDHAQRIRSDLLNAGILVNEEKSIWNPCNELEWLGLIIDLSNSISLAQVEKEILWYRFYHMQLIVGILHQGSWQS